MRQTSKLLEFLMNTRRVVAREMLIPHNCNQSVWWDGFNLDHQVHQIIQETIWRFCLQPLTVYIPGKICENVLDVCFGKERPTRPTRGPQVVMVLHCNPAFVYTFQTITCTLSRRSETPRGEFKKRGQYFLLRTTDKTRSKGNTYK